MSIELPRDAEGREIPLDTVALFNRDGNVYSIVRWTFTTDFDLSDGWSNKWRAITDRGFALDPALVYLTTPEPDTWEKLEDDLDRCIEADGLCSYRNQSGVCFKSHDNYGTWSIPINFCPFCGRKLEKMDE